MVGRRERVLVCSPRAAGWNQPTVADRWRRLGFLHPPDFEKAQAHHDKAVWPAGIPAEWKCVPSAESPMPWVDPPSIPTTRLCRPIMVSLACILANLTAFRKRSDTSNSVEAWAYRNWAGFKPPGKTEAGDMVWLDSKTLLTGQGYRTNPAGIEQMRALLMPHGIEVLSAPLPYGTGPSACLHLMSLMSLLDEQTVLVDLPWLAVETVELLKSRGYRLVEIEYWERDTLACNVLALGERRLLGSGGEPPDQPKTPPFRI